MSKTTTIRAALMGASLLALGACTLGNGRGDFDFDFRGNAADTSGAALGAGADRPQADDRGVIAYPSYSVAVARQGDTVASMADRVGTSAAELARTNALTPDTRLGRGEVLVLPKGAGAPPAAGGTGLGTERVDVTTLAGNAIARTPGTPLPPASVKPGGVEPIRHKVVRGETAYTIARAYNVPAKTLAEWNGLGADLAVREGQYLMIPAAGAAPAPAAETRPGQGSPTPVPPSASKPLPANDTTPAAKPAPKPPTPDLGGQTTAASGGKLAMPVSGSIARPYSKGKNDGIDIAAAAGSTVKAAAGGTVAAITKDTAGTPILVLRHSGNLLTVYANLDGIMVKKGDTVKSGQAIAKLRGAALHFEVREGFDSVDPMKYLK